MNYKITLPDGTTQAIQIIGTTFKQFKVWLVRFKDGKQAVLYKCGNEWLQRSEDFLDNSLIMVIGRCIDGFSEKNLSQG
jgi:hypothetical protein